MTRKKVQDIVYQMAEINPDAIAIDGFYDCIIGMCNTHKGVVLAYSEAKIIKKLTDEGMLEDEAWHYYDTSILNAHTGEYAPVFLIDSK